MSKVPFRTSPMLATLTDGPFTKSNWVFEEKYDGVRILAYKEGKPCWPGIVPAPTVDLEGASGHLGGRDKLLIALD